MDKQIHLQKDTEREERHRPMDEWTDTDRRIDRGKDKEKVKKMDERTDGQ